MNTTKTEELLQSFSPALQWFKNKALRDAQGALERLAVAAERGYWLPEDKCRSIRAALNKSAVASTFAREEARAFRNAPMSSALYGIGHCMEFGLFEQAAAIDFSGVKVPGLTDYQLVFIETGIRYAKSFRAIVEALTELDATRPAPVFTYLGASPTITRTLESLGLHVKPEASVPVLRVEKVEIMADGKKTFKQVCYLEWPVDTIHGASRWHCEDSQCEACGHGIKRDNWVPLILHNEAGVPYSLWTGRDCARTLFGIKVTGELNLDSGNDPHQPQPDGTAISVAPEVVS